MENEGPGEETTCTPRKTGRSSSQSKERIAKESPESDTCPI